MSKDLEDRIRQWVDDEVAGVEPVTVDEALDRASESTVVPMAAGGYQGRRWLVPAIAAAAIVIAGAVGFVVFRSDRTDQELVVSSDADVGPEGAMETRPEVVGSDQDPGGRSGPGQFSESTEDGWTAFVEPTFGWTWEQPVAWTSQSERNYCDYSDDGFGMSQTVITNTDRRISHPIVDSGCNNTWALPQPLPGGFLGIAVMAMGDTMAVLGDFPAEPTKFPLDADDLKPYEGAPVGILPDRALVINHEGRRYVVSTYEGPGVAEEDRAALERIIESIDPADLPAADPIEFGWLPADATVFAGPPPPVSATARLEFVDGEGGVDESRSVRVDARTIRGALLFARVDMEAEEPEVQPELLPGVTPSRERIQLRGVEVVHDRAVDGDTSVSRLVFFDYDNLAVEVLAENVPDDELYRIVEGLRLVAVGGPSG